MPNEPDDMRPDAVPFETKSPVTDLVRHIMRALEIDGQWRGLFGNRDLHGVSAARSAGRAAGRNLGVRVYTSAADRADGSIEVSVHVRRDSAPAVDRARWAERTHRLVDDAVDDAIRHYNP